MQCVGSHTLVSVLFVAVLIILFLLKLFHSYDILLRSNFESTIRNREVSTIGRVLKYYTNSPAFGTASSVHYLKVFAIGRRQLREVPL